MLASIRLKRKREKKHFAKTSHLLSSRLDLFTILHVPNNSTIFYFIIQKNIFGDVKTLIFTN